MGKCLFIKSRLISFVLKASLNHVFQYNGVGFFHPEFSYILPKSRSSGVARILVGQLRGG